jgi:glycosyltransferase involved in cell wall biosynthesis
VGLFPLQDTERSAVRGVLKAAVYMCGEVALIASPIGQVADVITDGVNGLVARTPEEWATKLDTLVSDAALRKKLTAGGLQYVQTHFRTHQSWELLRPILRGEAA